MSKFIIVNQQANASLCGVYYLSLFFFSSVQSSLDALSDMLWHITKLQVVVLNLMEMMLCVGESIAPVPDAALHLRQKGTDALLEFSTRAFVGYELLANEAQISAIAFIQVEHGISKVHVQL